MSTFYRAFCESLFCVDKNFLFVLELLGDYVLADGTVLAFAFAGCYLRWWDLGEEGQVIFNSDFRYWCVAGVPTEGESDSLFDFATQSFPLNFCPLIFGLLFPFFPVSVVVGLGCDVYVLVYFVTPIFP